VPCSGFLSPVVREERLWEQAAMSGFPFLVRRPLRSKTGDVKAIAEDGSVVTRTITVEWPM